MIFTSVKVSAGGGEFSFFTEDGSRYTISSADAKRLGLSELSADDMPFGFEDDELMDFLSSKLSAIKYCTYLLSFSDKSEYALKQKMREKGYVGEVAEQALRVLKESGFTDDEGLCAKRYTLIAKSKLYGPHRIKAELLAKGFTAKDINNAALECEVDFEQLLSELVNKLTRTSKVNLSDRKEVLKFKAKLSRYGYGFDTINAVLSQLCDDTEDFYGED